MNMLFLIWKSFWKFIGGRSSLVLVRKGVEWKDCKVIMEIWMNFSKRFCRRYLGKMFFCLLMRFLGY